MRSWTAWMLALPSVLGEITCQDNFQDTSDMGGRGEKDQRLGAWQETEGHAHLLCQGVDADGNAVQSTCEFKSGDIGFKTGWQSANPFGETRWKLEEVNGQKVSLGTLEIPERYSKYKICGTGDGGDVWQFSDAMIIENKLGGTEATIMALAFLNDEKKSDVVAGEVFSVEANMGFCKLEMMVKIPVKADGNTTFSISINFHKDEGEDELNAGLTATISDKEIAISSDLDTADGSKNALVMATGLVCQSTKKAVPAADITIDDKFEDERRFAFTVAQAAVSSCEFLYWDPTSVPFKGSASSSASSQTNSLAVLSSLALLVLMQLN